MGARRRGAAARRAAHICAATCKGSPMHSRPLRRRRGRRAVAAPTSTAKTRIDRSWPPTASRAARSSLRSGGCRWCSLADAGRQRPVALRPPAPLPDRSALRLRWDGAGSSELATEAGRPHRRRAFVAARPSARSGSPTRSGRRLGGPSTTRLPASRRPLVSWRLRRTRTPEPPGRRLRSNGSSQLPVAVSSVGLCAIISSLPWTISKLACQLRGNRARVRGSWPTASA